MSTVKDAISQAVDRLADELEALSIKIHDNPELGLPRGQGLRVALRVPRQAGLQGRAGRGRRRDGLPRHHRDRRRARPSPSSASTTRSPASGTPAATTSSRPPARARARRSPPSRAQLPKGRIHVIGTPAEEGGGGKVKLIKAGLFKDVDAAMMIHGFDRTLLHQDLLGIARATLRVHRQGLARLGRSVGGHQCAGRLRADLQCRRHAAPAGAPRLPHPRHHHERRRGGQHHSRVRVGDLLHARPAHRHDVGALPARGRLRRGRGQGGGLRAQGDPARQRLRADEVEPRAARSLRGQHDVGGPERRASRSPTARARPTSAMSARCCRPSSR